MMAIMKKKISIVIPAHNEEKNISFLVDQINSTMLQQDYSFELIFVDDGSRDNTLNEIKASAEIYHNILYIELSRNFGKDHALKAGIAIAQGNAVITMDADLQHPPHFILHMLNLWENGHDIIYTYREQANPHARGYQKATSRLFYKGINMFTGIKLENGTADFRLMDEIVVKQLKRFDEYEIFYRGIIKWTGFKQIGIPYLPSKRHMGEASYSFFKLVKLALHFIMAFSARPLYIASGIGLFFSLAAILYIPYVLISYIAGYAVGGWSSMIATIAFFGGLELLVLGLIGIYVGKIFMQSKQRPNFIIRSTNVSDK
jgi:glycosyltransferase involved in cell wall biosynthesis